MADKRTTLVWALRDEVSAAAQKMEGKLQGLARSFDKLGGPGSGASLFGNVGAKAVAKGFSMIDTAASATIGFLGDSIDAAKEEAMSIAKLDAALRANIPSWDGNRDAIERVLSSRMRLGFSDEEQRASLALLVAAGDDVTTSLDLQRTAMDLARLKNISLEEATGALIKTEDGHYRVLQSLGIKLADNATAQDAVNAVQAIANNQAEAFATGPGGRQLATQIKINEAMEKIGNVLLPIVATAMEALAAVAVPALELMSSALSVVFAWLGHIADAVKAVIGWFQNLDKETDKIRNDVGGLGRYGGFGNVPKGYASGGVVPGPMGMAQLAVVHGGETVTPPGGGSGFTIQGVSESDMMEMVERRLYFRLSRATPTSLRK
jgi:hypothetical protein